jgi:hypothetical protein
MKVLAPIPHEHKRKEHAVKAKLWVSMLALGCAALTRCTSDETTRLPGTSSGGSSGSGGGTGGTQGTGGSANGSGGAAAGSGGAAGAGGGSGGSGDGGGAGSGGTDLLPDAAGTGGDPSDAGGSGDALAPLTECGKPSVDRLENWEASGEGTTVPKTGQILVKEGDHYVGKVKFVEDGNWHVIPVYLGNVFESQADISKASGFWLTYSATNKLSVQVRPASHWDGGDQYATPIPATGGQKKTAFFSFASANWKSLFGPPALPYADVLKEARALVFVGDTANDITFYGLRIDGYTPPCL